ncbi:EamA family transporter [Bacterioplanes sanyensis]|uniref:EamA family transporter n=1 Tax=Bacterioplanes sanyensis TaxID=1249553 RepID=A0A222FGS1_9GAMM|nr:DMT family transporter [Bacterioplanes sanyensis]ASP37443.1 EamA family transporter [Bacterioplanes sanyensis]
MTNTSVAVALLVLGNFIASLADVSVKNLDGDISAVQYTFLRQCMSLLIVLPFWLRQERHKRALSHNGVTLVRAHLIMVGSGCTMMAITYLPLATANAIFYTAPLIMLPLSVWLLNEAPKASKVIGSLIGFVGVLVVLRPSQFHWAAWFALGTAVSVAIFHLLARRLPAEQSVVTTLFWTSLFSLPISGVLALAYWQPLSWPLVGWVFMTAVCVLAYNGLAVLAYKKAPADQISMAEYTGLIFVTLMGIAWFAEVPDWLSLFGMALIIVPLLPWRTLVPKLKHWLLGLA